VEFCFCMSLVRGDIEVVVACSQPFALTFNIFLPILIFNLALCFLLVSLLLLEVLLSYFRSTYGNFL